MGALLQVACSTNPRFRCDADHTDPPAVDRPFYTGSTDPACARLWVCRGGELRRELTALRMQRDTYCMCVGGLGGWDSPVEFHREGMIPQEACR